eukprot:XP_023973189.1 nuclear RNA export factor 3-like [Physeter catodon]
MEYNKQVTSLQRRARCRHIYQRRYNNWSEEVRSGIHPSSQQQQDGDQATSDVHKDTGVRYAPYAIPFCHRRGNFQKKDETHVNKATEQKPPERKMERNRQDETLGSWFKIRIPFGIKYDEKWLLNLIQKQCSVPFTPVEFHYEKMQAQFFIENANIAFALKNVNGVIYNEANERISIFVEPCDAPHSVLKELKSEKVEQIKLPVKERYDVSQQSLDIQRVRSDPGWDTGVWVYLSWLCFSGPCGSSSSSQVKSAGEMDKGERLEPEGMCADRNPLCTTFPDKSTNISSILELFPKLLTLKLKDPHLRVQLLKHTKRVILHTLCVLPKTQHDFSSFVVDTWFQTETMLCFSVSGVFKEVEGSSQGCVRAFTRTFIAIPASSSSLCIVNDELFVSDSNPKKTESVFLIPKPTCCASSISTLSMEWQAMVQAFSTWSGMNVQDSQK